jgi:hypothetical protein
MPAFICATCFVAPPGVSAAFIGNTSSADTGDDHSRLRTPHLSYARTRNE